MLGHRMGIEPSPLAPELSAWEVAAYRTMFERATYESGGRLRRADLEQFLAYIGVRKRVRQAYGGAFGALEHFGQMLSAFARVADVDGVESPAGSIGFDEILALLNRYREEEREI